MHDHAEHGVAAHWAYKEAGTKGLCRRFRRGSDYDAKIAVLRQLLAWERDLSGSAQDAGAVRRSHLRVDTRCRQSWNCRKGATAVDFAYTVHTSLGHRCRGAHAWTVPW
jgi:GTP pyrophosphokinase